ncbi:hypothetical protein V8C37DRAFT_366945 [Trichoderma ceciliae]
MPRWANDATVRYPQTHSASHAPRSRQRRRYVAIADRCSSNTSKSNASIESIKSVETGIVTRRELLLTESLTPALVRPRLPGTP